MIALVVTNPFGTRLKGEHITDAAEIAAALETNPASVVRVNLPDAESAPAPQAEEPAPASAV